MKQFFIWKYRIVNGHEFEFCADTSLELDTFRFIPRFSFFRKVFLLIDGDNDGDGDGRIFSRKVMWVDRLE